MLLAGVRESSVMPPAAEIILAQREAPSKAMVLGAITCILDSRNFSRSWHCSSSQRISSHALLNLANSSAVSYWPSAAEKATVTLSTEVAESQLSFWERFSTAESLPIVSTTRA